MAEKSSKNLFSIDDLVDILYRIARQFCTLIEKKKEELKSK